MSLARRKNWLQQDSKASLQVLESSFSVENIPRLRNPTYVRESSTTQPESEYEKAIFARQTKSRQRKPHVGKNECFNELRHSWERTSSRALWEAQVSNSSESLHLSRLTSNADCSNALEQSITPVETCAPMNLTSSAAAYGVRTLIQIYEDIAKTNNKPCKK